MTYPCFQMQVNLNSLFFCEILLCSSTTILMMNFVNQENSNNQHTLIQNMPIVFPNLKKLSVFDAKCSTLRKIFIFLPNLEELHIVYIMTRFSKHSVINLSQTLTGLPDSYWISTAFRNYVADEGTLPKDKEVVLEFLRRSTAPCLQLMTSK
jgi:hypothetical protein